MAQKTTINGSYSLTNNSDTVNVNLNSTITTTGSLFVKSTMITNTGSWQTIDQNKNNDFRSGVFGNEDFTSSIKLALGNTASIASILQPQDTVVLAYSGSTTLYCQSISGTPLLSYTAISLN